MTKPLPPHLKKRRTDEWRDERIERLRELWALGLSGAEIGRRMGKTRCAINGKAHRLGLPHRMDETLRLNRKAAAQEREAEFKRRHDALADAKRRQAEVERLQKLTTTEATEATVSGSRPVHFMDARLGQCFYPLWSGKARTGNVCGAATGGGRFCHEHERRCFVGLRG